LHAHCKDLLPGDSVLRRTPAQSRLGFNAAVKECHLDSGVRPYSLRRGGSTYHFRLHGSIDKTMEIGRWQHLKTARVYVNTALSEVATLRLGAQASAAVRQYSDALGDIL
jgi:hypothetical protein